MQAAARRPQAHRGVARQPGAAVVQHPDVLGADAAVHQPHLMHGRHTVEDGLQHGAGGGDVHGAGVVLQPLLQGTPAGVFHHGVDGVVLLKHIQHRLQTVGGGDTLDGAVQVGKIHPRGLEQHLAAGLGAEQAVAAPLCGQRQGHILLEGDPEAAQILDTAIQNALAVDALYFAHGVPPGQHRARREAAHRVAPRKAPPAVGADLGQVVQLLHTVRTDAFRFHGGSPLRRFWYLLL